MSSWKPLSKFMLLFVLRIMRASWVDETTQQIMKVELELQAWTDEAFAGLKEWVDQRAAKVFTDVKERQRVKFVDLVREKETSHRSKGTMGREQKL